MHVLAAFVVFLPFTIKYKSNLVIHPLHISQCPMTQCFLTDGRGDLFASEEIALVIEDQK